MERLRAQLVRKLGLAEEEAGKLELCTVNTWQPWRQTVRANPLALLDAASVDLERDTMKYSFAGSGLREQGFSKNAVGADGTPLIGLTHSPQHRCKPPRYRCRLGCILLTTAAVSLRTGPAGSVVAARSTAAADAHLLFAGFRIFSPAFRGSVRAAALSPACP